MNNSRLATAAAAATRTSNNSKQRLLQPKDDNGQTADIEAASDRQTGSASSSPSSSCLRSKRAAADSSSSALAGEHEEVVTSLQVNSKTTALIAADTIAPSAAIKRGEQAVVGGRAPQQAGAATATNHAATPGSYQVKKRKPKRVLDPSGSLCYNWSMVVSFAFLYNFWSLSYRFAFREIDFDSMAAWFALDYSADFIYLMDIIINSRTGYLEDGVLQRNVIKVRHHYGESTRFYLDGLCLLPLDILYLSFGFNSILRCTRLVKIYKFWHYVDRTERHTNYPNIFRTFTLVHYILVIFHWNACLFHMISKSKIIDLESLYKIEDNRCNDILCQYLHAFYWSTLGEFIYVIVELIFGLFLFATVLGHVANIVTNVSAARKEFQAKLDAVKTFMRMRRVSDELQNKVIRWFDYLWMSQQSSDEDKSVACLPDRLKAEIAIHVHLDTLKRVDIFQNTEAGFLCELVLRLKPVLFSPGDYVCRKNEVGHEMYIVSRGILEVVTDEGKVVVATLKAGSYFGEISVLNVGLAGNKRTASVRSVGYSDLFCLNKQDLWDVLKNYPNAEARIRARAEERLSKLDIDEQRRPSGRRPSKSKSQQPTYRQLQSASCSCFAATANSIEGGKGFSLAAPRNGDNNATRLECVCRRCLSSSSSKARGRLLRMPVGSCHKSPAAANNNRPPPVFVDRTEQEADEYDGQPANCRGHTTIQRNNRREPVSYSRSFERTAAKLSRQQQQLLLRRQADDKEYDEENITDNEDDSLPACDNAISAGHKARLARFTRRSSSAEPPIEADSRRQLSRHSGAVAAESAASGPARQANTRRQASCSISIDDQETTCSSCARHQRQVFAATSQPPTAYWILQQAQQQQQPVLIQVPTQGGSSAVSPFSQPQQASPIRAAQSVSSMYLNLQPPPNSISDHQGALLSPALISARPPTVPSPMPLSVQQQPQPSPLYFCASPYHRTAPSAAMEQNEERRANNGLETEGEDASRVAAAAAAAAQDGDQDGAETDKARQGSTLAGTETERETATVRERGERAPI